MSIPLKSTESHVQLLSRSRWSAGTCVLKPFSGHRSHHLTAMMQTPLAPEAP